jgi:hypothetical protein
MSASLGHEVNVRSVARTLIAPSNVQGIFGHPIIIGVELSTSTEI